MIAPNVVPGAILGINFLQENKVVKNIAKRRFETRRYSSNCETNFCDSLPEDKIGVAVISNPVFQLNFPESQTTKQLDGKDHRVGAQTTHALMPV
jgi:hypothetical protein